MGYLQNFPVFHLGPAIVYKFINRLIISVVAATILSPIGSYAQQPSSIGFDQRQTEQRLDSSQSQQRRGSQPTLRRPQLSDPAEGLDTKPAFVLRGVTIHGAKTIAIEEIQRVYRPYLGKTVSPADLADIAKRIGDIYRTAGYHLSRAFVPPQDVTGGRIRIKVVEGKITELAIVGDKNNRFGLRPILEPILSEYPSRLFTVERKLLLANDRPGVKIDDATLEEVGAATGNFRLVVVVKTWRIYSSVGLDNLGSSSVGPWQTYATAAFNSYFTAGDVLALNLLTVPTDPQTLAFSRLKYETPIGLDGARIGVTALHSEVMPRDARRLYGDTTTTDSFEVRASIVPIQSQFQTLSFAVAVGVSNVSEKDIIGPVYNDRIRTLSFSSDYRLTDGFGGTNYFFASVRQGLNILGASRKDDDFLSRDGASGDFSVLNASFTRYQRLAGGWSIRLSAAAQFASAPLLTSQQFYLGGASLGRGYNSAEISGDNAIAESFELRFDEKVGFKYLQGFQLYGFVDNGAAWNFGNQYKDGPSLTSVGTGIRFFFSEDLTAGLALAIPLTYRSPDNEMRSPRILFSVSNAIKLCTDKIDRSCL